MTFNVTTCAGNPLRRVGVERREPTRAPLTEAHQPQHIEQILRTLLQGIGLAPDEARAIAFMPLPDVGPTSPCIFATLQSA